MGTATFSRPHFPISVKPSDKGARPALLDTSSPVPCPPPHPSVGAAYMRLAGSSPPQVKGPHLGASELVPGSRSFSPAPLIGRCRGASWVLRVSPPPHLPLSLPSSLAPTLVTSAPYYWCTLRGVALPQSPQLESGNNSAYLLGLFVKIKRVIKCKALRILAGV